MGGRRIIVLAVVLAVGGATALVILRDGRLPTGPSGGTPLPASVHVVYVQHEGVDHGRAVGDIIRSEAATARDASARLVFVLEWPAPFSTYEAWQAADPGVAGISKEAFMKLAPETAAAEGGEQEAGILFRSWVRWRDGRQQRARAERSVGRADPAFGAEVDRALQDAGDVLAELFIEGGYPGDGLDEGERERRDWQLFVTWSQAYRNYLYAQLCENNQILQAFDEGDPGRFRLRAREGIRVHREALRRRNEVMAATLRWVVATGTASRPVRVVLLFGLAHAFVPTLKDALGDVLVETRIPPHAGRYENVLEIYLDVDAFERRGDGGDPDRYVLSTQMTRPAELRDPGFVKARDELLAALAPADVDAVIAGLRGLRASSPAARVDRVRRALGERVLSAGRSLEAREAARRWLAKISALPGRPEIGGRPGRTCGARARDHDRKRAAGARCP
jgi:hypothetical protein